MPIEGVLGFYNSSGTLLDTVWGHATTTGTTGWTAIADIVAIAPLGTTSVALGFVVQSTSAGQIVYMTSPILQATAGAGSPAVHGPLHTSGNAILDANGNRVILRGVNAFGLESSDNPPVLNQEQVLAAKQWGANMARIALGEQLWLASSCEYDPNYVAAVDKMVNWVTSLGMVALLDLHWDTLGCAPPGQMPMADNPGSIQFWQQVAARYAGNPLVAFELYNEPYNVSDSVWLSGGTATVNGTTYQAAGMQQLYDAVRSTGSTNLVFVSGTNWAEDVPYQPVQGTNIVYSVHAYTCPQSTTTCFGSNAYDPSQILGPWVTPGQYFPVMVTEFGWPSPSDGTYNQAVIAFAQSQGWGWSPFIWDGTTTSPWSLVSEMLSSGPFEPSPSGMPVLAALAGLP